MTRAQLLDTLSVTYNLSPVTFITGDAGMGKSTILRQVEQVLQGAESTACVFADCSSPVGGMDIGSVESLHPWITAMKGLVTASSKSSAHRLATDLAMAWIKFIPIVGDVIESTITTVGIVKKHNTGNAETPVSKEHVFEQCISFFKTVAEKQSVVVIIDDAHWADDSSVNLLFALARCGIPNLKCIVAYRPHDVATSRNGSEHPLARTERELNRYQLCQHIEVPPLSDEELTTLIGEVHGASDATQFDSIKKFSNGNPLLAAGWTNSKTLSPTVEAVVHEQIQRCDRELKELLMSASSEGEVFTSLVLRSLTSHTPLHIASLLRKAESDHGLIRALGKREQYATDTQAYEFTNNAVYRAFEKSLGQEESVLLHQAVAEVLATEFAQLERTEPAWMNTGSRLAVHYNLAHQHEQAARLSIELGTRAWDLFAEHEALHAVQQAESALSKVKRVTDSIHEVTIALLELKIRIFVFTRRVDEAHQECIALRELALKTNHPEAAINALVRRAQLSSMMGFPDDVALFAHQALDESLAIGYANGERGSISMLGMWHESYGRITDALASFERTLALAQELGTPALIANSLVNIGRQRTYLKEHQAALECFMKAVEYLDDDAHPDALAKALNNAGISLKEMGRLDEAAAHFRRALGLHESIGDKTGYSSLCTNLGQLFLGTDRLSEAMEYFETSIAIKREIHDAYGLSFALYSKGLALAEQKNVAESLEYLNEALQCATSIGEQLIVDEVERNIREIEQWKS